MKLFDNLSDIEELVGCNIKLPYWYNDEKYLFLDVVDKTISFLGFSDSVDAAKKNLSWFGRVEDLLVLKPKYVAISNNINMEQYIASYKHLIGCEHIIHGRGLTFYFTDKSIESIVRGFDINNLRFYLDDESLGTYEEYMQLHYPEYEYIWKQQL